MCQCVRVIVCVCVFARGHAQGVYVCELCVSASVCARDGVCVCVCVFARGHAQGVFVCELCVSASV